MELKPGVSSINPLLSVTNNSVCLVVFFPLLVLLEISPISKSFPKIFEIRLVFPTPLGPENETILFFTSL